MEKFLESLSKINQLLLTDLPVNTILDEIVAKLGDSQGVSRCYIFKNHQKEDKLFLSYLHEWCAPDTKPQINNPNLYNCEYDDFPGLFETLSTDNCLFGLVEESTNELFKKIMTEQGILTYLFIPIFEKKEFWGWIGLDDCSKKTIWSKSTVNALFTVARNIGLFLSKRKEEKEKEKQIKKYQLALSGSQQGMYEIDFKNNNVIFSPSMMHLIGYQENEFEHTLENWCGLMHPNDLDYFHVLLDKYLNREEKDLSIEYRMKHKNGEWAWVKGNGAAQWDHQNQAILMVGNVSSIDKEKRQEIIIREERNKFNSILNNLGEVVFTLCGAGKITFLNKYWEVLTDKKIDSSIGVSFLDFFDFSQNPDFEKEYQLVLNKTKETCSSETLITTTQSQKKWVRVHFRGIASKSEFEIAGTIQDIHEQKLAFEKQIELNSLKSNFISLASHQFRTPLTIIYSNVEVTELALQKKTDGFNEKLEKSLLLIKKQVDRLSLLMDNILTIGHFEANKIAFKISQQDINEVIYSVLENNFNAPFEKNLIVFLPKENLPKVWIDEMLFGHIITNVFSNALKYSLGKTPTTISLDFKDSHVQILVKDSGIGIPQEELDKVFNSFYRASNAATIQGSGLGLAIAKQFIELMGGKIEIFSKIKEGTTVKLYLPIGNTN